MLALARKIVSGEEDAVSVEAVFAQARQVAAEAEALLVDDGWRAPEPEPVVIEAAGVAAVAVADDGGATAQMDEPQVRLFSWAEFLAEQPDLPKRRRRKPAHASHSLFEWALERRGAPPSSSPDSLQRERGEATATGRSPLGVCGPFLLSGR